MERLIEIKVRATAGCCVARAVVSPGVAVSANWYVTFELRPRGLLNRRARSPRETRTFATEAQAKAFARSKLDEGLVVFAGTINPHLPKQLILSQHMADWLVEQ